MSLDIKSAPVAVGQDRRAAIVSYSVQQVQDSPEFCPHISQMWDERNVCYAGSLLFACFL